MDDHGCDRRNITYYYTYIIIIESTKTLFSTIYYSNLSQFYNNAIVSDFICKSCLKRHLHIYNGRSVVPDAVYQKYIKLLVFEGEQDLVG